ncbi:hypothetical protein J6X15_00530 [Candidatus Saccharibacteria bacterium]|nr:hypothetical protein [Candidatus Saccharibacteria bacterium]MBP5656058.1 hypothetical protein [Candidatus Saccharibacteria bacterium]
MSRYVNSLTHVPTSRLEEQYLCFSTRTFCLELLRVEESLETERRDRVFFARAYSALEDPHFIELIDLATRHIERLKKRERILQRILRIHREQLIIDQI